MPRLKRKLPIKSTGPMSKLVERAIKRQENQNFRNSSEWRDLRKSIIDASNGRCHYCQNNMNMVFVDHVIPRSRGGSDTLENLVACCSSCSARKGASTPNEWATRERIFSCARNAVAAEFGEIIAKVLQMTIKVRDLSEIVQ